MAAPLLTLSDIVVSFGHQRLLDGASMIVEERDRIALVGRNGCGKSTFLRIAAGLTEPDGGQRTSRSAATFRYLEQDPVFDAAERIEDIVRGGLVAGDPGHGVPALLADLGLDPDRQAMGLSGGEARRVALARAVAPEPDILLLDEPTNHLDLPSIAFLEEWLRGFRGATVIISHDRRFLSTLTTRTVFIDRGKTRALAQGFSAFEAWRDQLYADEERDAHKLDRLIEREEHWLRYGVTARRKRNVRRLGELHALRHQRATMVHAQGSATMQLAESGESGKRVIEARGVTFGYAERPIVRDLSMRINRGDRVGIAGPNGAGKTTLLRLLTGQLPPQQGEVALGTKLDIVTLDQQRAGLRETERVVDAVTGGRGDSVMVGGEQRHASGYLKDFLFRPEQLRQPVAALSGGERGRLCLAIAFARPSNLLILDEPTNDLDLETLDVLEEAIDAYQGTVLLVSHDRDFLDRIVTQVLAPAPEEGAGVWREYAGGYSDMLAQRAARPATPLRASAGRGPSGASKPAGASAPAPASGGATRPSVPERAAKLSYKEKYALENLPRRIAALEQDITSLETQLADPGLYARSRTEAEAAGKALSSAREELAKAEEEWLALALRQEALDEA